MDHEAVLAAMGFLSRTVMALRTENEQLRVLAGIPAGVPIEVALAQRGGEARARRAEQNGNGHDEHEPVASE